MIFKAASPCLFVRFSLPLKLQPTFSPSSSLHSVSDLSMSYYCHWCLLCFVPYTEVLAVVLPASGFPWMRMDAQGVPQNRALTPKMNDCIYGLLFFDWNGPYRTLFLLLFTNGIWGLAKLSKLCYWNLQNTVIFIYLRCMVLCKIRILKVVS